MQEKARIVKNSWCYSRFLIHFSIRKKWLILWLRIPVLQSKQVILIRSTRSTYTVSPTKPDQNMTNLHCTADHHVVPPLNIRHVESGIIPDHFQPFEELVSLTTTSQSGPDQPRCILDQDTLSLIKARSLPICQFFQSGRKRGLIDCLVWTGLNIYK